MGVNGRLDSLIFFVYIVLGFELAKYDLERVKITDRTTTQNWHRM